MVHDWPDGRWHAADRGAAEGMMRMMVWKKPVAVLGALVLGLVGLGAVAQDSRGPAAVDVARMAQQETDGKDWLHDGRTYSAQRYSPLTQIDASNVSQLGIAWYDELDTYRGVEATPIYADGVLY